MARTMCPGRMSTVIGVAGFPVRLGGGGHQQLEHEQAPFVTVEVVRDQLESGELRGRVGGGVVRVEADEHLDDVRPVIADVGHPAHPVLEVEDRLAALLDADRPRNPPRRRVGEDLAPELRVHQDSDLLLRNPALDRPQQAAVDQALGGGDGYESVALRVRFPEPRESRSRTS